MTPKQKVDYALRQVVNHHDFFGPAAMAMPWQECYEIPTACTNGKVVRYNPDFIDGLTKFQTVGLVLHELLHPLLGHLDRLATQFKTDHQRANQAADYEINNYITSYNRDVAIPVVLPPDGCIDVEKWGDLSAEVIYKRLSEEPTPEPDGGDSDSDSDDSDDSGSGDSGSGDSGDSGDSGSDDSDSDSGDTSSGCGEFELPDDGSDSSIRDSANKWREILSSCIQTAKLRGKGGGDFIQKLEGMFESPLSLEELLSKYVTEFCIGDESTKPDRRFLALHDICITGNEDERHGTLVFVRDTSGSIDSDTMKSITSIIQDTVDTLNFDQVAVIDADDKICDVNYYGPYDTISLEIKGRGGTDFVPAFKYVEDEIEDAQVVIYLTDGYGYFPNPEPSTPTLWITYGLNEEHFPFGDVVELSEILASR
jgi:predicted metal-dependent peptidase